MTRCRMNAAWSPPSNPACFTQVREDSGGLSLVLVLFCFTLPEPRQRARRQSSPMCCAHVMLVHGLGVVFFSFSILPGCIERWLCTCQPRMKRPNIAE